MRIAVPGSPRSLGWLLPAGLLAAAVAVLAGVVALSQLVGPEDMPPVAPPFSPPAGPEAARFVVKQAIGGKVSVIEDAASGSPAPMARDIAAGPATTIEVLRPIGIGDVRPGSWVAVTGIPNGVRSFTMHGIVVIANPGGPDADRVVRSAGGFSGAESGVEAADRVVTGGIVERIEAGVLSLAGPAGPIRVDVRAAAAPLLELQAGTAADIREGDRIAVLGPPEAPSGILVQREGR